MSHPAQQLQHQATEKATLLAAQFPKRCGCGLTYLRSAWATLPRASSRNGPDGTFTDAFATHEMRNCACNSTLVVLTEIHDLSEQ